MIFHTLTLVGNYNTAKGIELIGKSVDGWSEVGLATSKAMAEDLDPLLSNVTFQLTQAVEETITTQDMIDGMLSTFSAAGAASFLQDSSGGHQVIGDPGQTVMNALEALPHFEDSLKQLQTMFETIKPALMQVAVFVETFSDQVQATVEAFGTTVDRVQKIFDQAMAQLKGTSGEGFDLMIHDTFNLFDVDSSGRISIEDMHNVAALYAIYAVDGEKGQELIDQYDTDGDGEISEEEYPDLMEDSSVKGIMAVILREYAKRLSTVAGNVGAARMRSEVSSNVVAYFQLVCSKNLTKVGWIADMLTNGTLPMDFTADVLAELALNKDDPNLMTAADVGQIVVGMMMQQNSEYTLQALELMSDPDHWEKEGFNMDDLPGAVEIVTDWTTTGPDFVNSLEDVMESLKQESSAKGQALPKIAFNEMVSAMPAVARKLSQAKVDEHHRKKLRKRMEKRLGLYGKQEQQIFLEQLLHGVAATDGGAPDLALRALAAGVPAHPETLQFAQWLKANATVNSDLYVAQSFAYTGQSSSPVDAFNTQIQGMVKKLSGVIDVLKRYATPASVDKLELMIEDFSTNGMNDIFSVVSTIISNALGKKEAGGSTALLQIGHQDALHSNASSNTSSSASGEFRPARVSEAPHQPHAAAQAKLLNLKSASAFFAASPRAEEKRRMSTASMPQKLHPLRAVRRTGHAEAHSASAARGLAGPRAPMRRAMGMHTHRGGEDDPASGHQTSRPQTLRSTSSSWHLMPADNQVEYDEDQLPQMLDAPLSGAWDQVSQFLREVESVMPQAIDTLKFARLEVSAVSETLDSLFGSLKEEGPPIFEYNAQLYRLAFTLYFFLMLPLTTCILFYAFWAAGYVGGPFPGKRANEGYEEPQGCCAKLTALCCCLGSCCSCLRRYHDWHMCLWSVIVLWEVIVLIMFVVSLVFAILAGVTVFVSNGCSSIYILGDEKVCTDAFFMLQRFLQSFIVGEGETPLSMTCQHYNLMTCEVIQDRMVGAAVLTVASSFIATFFSFQIVFDTAMRHEKARWHRLMSDATDDKDRGASSLSA